MKEATTEFNGIVSLSETEHQQFIENKKREIVAYHLQHNPYYRNFVGNNDSKNWNTIPVMTKKDFQKSLSERLSNGFPKKQFLKIKLRALVAIPSYLQKINMHMP
jgi:phenylacetate-CoA ligase